MYLERRLPTSRRFAFLRLVGDHLTSTPEDMLLPATEARTARQKIQRAFAQEFLCPFRDLRAFLGTDSPTDEHLEQAADTFRVSPLLVRTTLVNRGMLPRESLAGIRPL